MKIHKLINYKIFILLILIMTAGYLIAFYRSGSIEFLYRFDNIMTEDAAQVARNTVRGNFFTTKYITPASYTYFPYLENHPDYIRYPFIVVLYSLLFLIGPQSAATIKAFNGLLFLINGLLVFVISLSLLERKKNCTLSQDVKNWLSALTAIMVSFILENYFRFALSDEYEIPTITAMLILIITLTLFKYPALTGAAQAIVYLCRPNMVVFFPFIWLYLIWEEKEFRDRIRITLAYVCAFLLVLSPFIIRNIILTGKLLFNYQQLFELYSGVTATHNNLYNNFAIASPLFPIEKVFLTNLMKKFTSEISDPFIFASSSKYLFGWIGIPFYILRFKENRNLFIFLLMGVFTHIVMLSFFIQVERVYVPIFFIMSVFGYLGILEWFSSVLVFINMSWVFNREFLFSSLIILSILCLSLTLPITPSRGRRTTPPSSEAIGIFKEYKIDCVYSNNPYWIPWYADIYSFYEPVNEEEMLTKGPKECNYFFADKRFPYPQVFLQNHGTLVDEGNKFLLIKLHQ